MLLMRSRYFAGRVRLKSKLEPYKEDNGVIWNQCQAIVCDPQSAFHRQWLRLLWLESSPDIVDTPAVQLGDFYADTKDDAGPDTEIYIEGRISVAAPGAEHNGQRLLMVWHIRDLNQSHASRSNSRRLRSQRQQHASRVMPSFGPDL